VREGWNGNIYWRRGNYWYNPCWRGDAIWYAPIYPPVGYWSSADDWEDEPVEVVIDDETYYEADGAYYEKTVKDGEEGYTAVADPTQTEPVPEPAPDPNLPDPFTVLKSGFDHLAAQNEFSMLVSDTFDEMTEEGSKISVSSRRKVAVHRPSCVAIDYTGDTEARQSLYDGQVLTILDRKQKAYGQLEVAGTIDTVLDKLAQDYGIVVASAELLRSNLYDQLKPKIQTGQYLGRDMDGVSECHHLGFTREDIDLEVWVDVGEQPVIRKISLSYKNVPGRPRYTMKIDSLVVNPIPIEAFKAKIPPDAIKVDLATRLADNQ